MKVVVIGGGESGVGAAILAKKQGFEVFLTDFGTISDAYKKSLQSHQISWEELRHTIDKIIPCDLAIKSPGIPDNAPLIEELKSNDVKIVSEIEFAYHFQNTETSKIIAITGSNGKTTTTMLCHHLLQEAGLDVALAGNIGQSYAKEVSENKSRDVVLELSSFQLDGIDNFRANIAIITNLSPDHLDRYNYDYQKYIESKFRITKNQTCQDALIYDADDTAIVQWLSNNKTKAQLFPFSLTKEVTQGAYLKDNNIIIMIEDTKTLFPTNELAIEGKHNVKNAMAATLVAQMMRVRNQTIRESLSSFKAVEHRLEKVAKINQVTYINDSKATNVNATYFALESVSRPTIWIVGGVDKGNDYDELLKFVNEKVKAVICLGIDNEKLRTSFAGIVESFHEATSMKQAVQMASRMANAGDTVLLSPACASFDLFKNYQHRGDSFKEEIAKL